MENPIVSGIAFNRDEAKVTVVGVPDVPGIASEILGAVAEANIDVDVIVQNIGHQGSNDLSFTLSRNELRKAVSLLESLKAEVEYRDLATDDQIAKVSLVGVGMKSHAGVAATMFRALGEENINIQMITTSEIKITVIIEERYLELAVRSIHSAFDLDHSLVTEEKS